MKKLFATPCVPTQPGVVYLHMSTDKPYGDTYMTEFLRLNEAQKEAGHSFAAQTLYLREEQAGRMHTGTRPEVRQRLADEAATEWLRIDDEIKALNRAEYQKQEAAKKARTNDECDGPYCRYPAVLP